MAETALTANKAQTVEIRPQAGPQEMFLSSSADIVIFGGAAGVGKTWGLLLDPLRHVNNAGFTCVTFRQTSPQVRNPGGLLDKSLELYPSAGGELKETTLEWEFPSGAFHKFAYLQYEKDVLQWQGTEVAQFNFDELTHFSEKQFFYMLSRNRSLCGVRPCIRGTVNPDADSWVAGLIAWWIDQETGLPIPERSGVIRYFMRINEVLVWADTKAELIEKQRDFLNQAIEASGGVLSADDLIKSLTFIAGTVYDNKKLLASNPSYLANLLALPLVERERLLGGNWKVRVTAGKLYNRSWFEIVAAAPEGGTECRYFDFASTAKETAKDDPDYTAGVSVRYVDGVFYVTNSVAEQLSPAGVERLFQNTISQDLARLKETKTKYRVRWEVEPGSAGKREAYQMAKRLLEKFGSLNAKGIPERKDKVERASPFAVAAEQGLVKVVRGEWNELFLRHLHNQPEEAHDDIRDAWAGASKGAQEKKGEAGHGKSIYD